MDMMLTHATALFTPSAARDAGRAAELAHDIATWSLTQLAYYKVPGYIAFVPELPLTITNKVQRGELKTLARTLPGSPMCIDTRALKKRQEPVA